MSDTSKEIRAIIPILWNAIKSGQLFNPACELTAPNPDIICEYEVKIPMSEGFDLTANIFKSKHWKKRGFKVPVIMCAHPYDNSILPILKKTPLGGVPQQYRMIPQVGKPRFSALTSWESPDPNFWVSNDYALVNLNLPGYGSSEGHATVMSDHQAKCFYEAIEWIAKQEWCTGRVGLNGVSFLAISQFHVASSRYYKGAPPSLKCICPWEGLTDMYKDQAIQGGISDVGFAHFWWATEVKPALHGTKEEFVKVNEGTPAGFIEKHPFYDDFWKEKAPDLENITIPMLVCASFSDQGLHTEGSFRAFMKARSEHKWVYTHRTGKWDSFYSPEVQQLTLQFMDCFLKDKPDNGFLNHAPVRLEVRSDRDTVHQVREESEWPLKNTEYKRLYLSENNRLTSIADKEKRIHQYPAKNGRLKFSYKFKKDTELTGYMKLRLWVEAQSLSNTDQPDDMAIFVAINKLDKNNKSVYFYGSVGNKKDMVSRGFCRVSRRELDIDESTEWHPVLSGTSEKPLSKGEIVPIDIAIYPSSTFFFAGESLELIISGKEIISSPSYSKKPTYNKGIHIIHTGGDFDSYLLIPEIY